MTQTQTTTENDSWDLIITPRKKWWDLQLRDVWRYRDLISLFVRRDFVSVTSRPSWDRFGLSSNALHLPYLYRNLWSNRQASNRWASPMLFYMFGMSYGTTSQAVSTALQPHLLPRGHLWKVYFPGW
jgi:lipopolysaccharide transport system permease protein